MFLGEMTDLRLGQQINQMSLEFLTVVECKRVLENKTAQQGYVKLTQEPTENSQWSQLEQ